MNLETKTKLIQALNLAKKDGATEHLGMPIDDLIEQIENTATKEDLLKPIQAIESVLAQDMPYRQGKALLNSIGLADDNSASELSNNLCRKSLEQLKPQSEAIN